MFSGISLPFGIAEMLNATTEFLKIYGSWILLVLAVAFSPVLYGLLVNLISWVSGNAAGGSGGFSKDEARGYRREMYDYLTKTGRIKERDDWVKKTGNPYSQ